MIPAPVPATSVSAAAALNKTATISPQNWVLSPVQDSVLIIVAPVLTLVMALAAMHFFGSTKGATLVLVSHVVFTVAHHLPTFIRIYGDVDLFRRFRWHFVFAPLISLTFCLGVLGYMNRHGIALENFMYLYIMLTLWDPWHFMRQHYGFMRIYDRVNAAPPALATRMDLWLSISWFAYIMVVSGDWLLDLLQDMYTRAQWPVLMALTRDGLHSITAVLQGLAVGVSLLYVGYVVWCWKKQYVISVPKLLMCLTTFGVMYLTYTPNAIIKSWAPDWSFKVGFAVIGIVHMTQYLAIVWRYNRKLTTREGRARSGWFNWLHSRGTLWAAGIYVAICLLYGDVITTVHNNAWLMAALLAVGFTSTMMHYYFDGFIWKMHHAQNQEMLVTTPVASNSTLQSSSWWSSDSGDSRWKVFARQFAYFAVPMGILTLASYPTWSRGHDNYVDHMYQAQTLNQQGLGGEAEYEARVAYSLMQDRLPLLARVVEFNPSGARRAELAFLIYNESMYEHLVIPTLDGQSPGPEQVMHHREAVQAAIDEMQRALSSGEALSHAGRESFSTADAEKVLASWKKQVG